MFKYLFFLIIGIITGYMVKERNIIKIQKYLLPFSVLVLLFFMGVGIGKDPNLKQKIVMFGYSSLIISLLAVFFSIVVVGIMMRVLRKK
ncbi:LysO family transporter [Deferribacter abyssi]|uniref:LysO family transporter n=1 Tax=Deferribacter abyssi TaxID=213806 RepID=UPI003C1E3426